VHCSVYSSVGEQMSFQGFTKSWSRINAPDVRRNLVPNLWTEEGEDALPELGPCPHVNSCVSCGGTYNSVQLCCCCVCRLRRCWRWWCACLPCSGCRTAACSCTTRSSLLVRTTTSGSCYSADSWSTPTVRSTPSCTTPCPSSSVAPSAASCSAAGPPMSAAMLRTDLGDGASWGVAAGWLGSTAGAPGRWPPTTRCTLECPLEAPASVCALTRSHRKTCRFWFGVA